MRWLPWALLLLLFLRYLLLAAACAPYGDDWGYALAGMRDPSMQRVLHEYHTWNGRYASNVLVLLGPLVLGPGAGLPLYRLVPVVLLLLAVAALAWALGGLGILRPRTSDRILIALGGTLVLLHAMPHLGEGVYWYTGAVTYLGGWVLLLVHVGVLLRPQQGPGHHALAVVTLVLAAGFNETAMVLLVVGHMACTAVALRRGWRGLTRHAVLLAVAVACGAVVALAPGNAVRSMHFPQRHDVMLTLFMGAAHAARHIVRWLADPVVAAVLFGVWQLGRRAGAAWTAGLRHHGPWPWLLAGLAAVLLGTLPPLWSMGMLGQYRTLNMVLGPFLVCCTGAALAYGTRWHGRAVWRSLDAPVLDRAMVLVALLGAVAWGNDRWVSQDLLSGDAFRFRTHTAHLHASLMAMPCTGEAPLPVPVFAEPLRSLRIPEPTADPEAYWNRTLAGYFGGDACRVVAAARSPLVGVKSSRSRRASCP